MLEVGYLKKKMNKRGLPISESQLVLESQGHDSNKGLSHTHKKKKWQEQLREGKTSSQKGRNAAQGPG